MPWCLLINDYVFHIKKFDKNQSGYFIGLSAFYSNNLQFIGSSARRRIRKKTQVPR